MKYLLPLCVVAAAACAPRTPPTATASDASRANVELAELQQGRTLLIQKCGGACHKTPMPGDHLAAEWPKKLDEMAERSKLEPMQRALIEKYLVTMASR
jgi:cytochrome c5